MHLPWYFISIDRNGLVQTPDDIMQQMSFTEGVILNLWYENHLLVVSRDTPIEWGYRTKVIVQKGCKLYLPEDLCKLLRSYKKSLKSMLYYDTENSKIYLSPCVNDLEQITKKAKVVMHPAFFASY